MGKKQPSEQTPVYAVVHASLRTQIFTGQYRPGDLLPSESHLCQEFGASRETVRRGLQQLENEGLIFSRPKIGYFVSQPNHNDMVLSLSEELEGTELQYRDIHGILPDERLQELLDIPANRKVIEFSQISRDGEGQGQQVCLQLVELLLAGVAILQVLLHQGGGLRGADAVVVQGQQVTDDIAGDFHSNSSFIFILAR